MTHLSFQVHLLSKAFLEGSLKRSLKRCEAAEKVMGSLTSHPIQKCWAILQGLMYDSSIDGPMDP